MVEDNRDPLARRRIANPSDQNRLQILKLHFFQSWWFYSHVCECVSVFKRVPVCVSVFKCVCLEQVREQKSVCVHVCVLVCSFACVLVCV